MKRTIGLLAVAALMVAAVPINFGGWAVVTFDDIPEYLVVNEATTLKFKIRQHGQTLVNDRSPSIDMRRSGQSFVARLLDRSAVKAHRTAQDGEYQVTIVPSEAGEVRLVVDTDVHGWKTELLPIPVHQSHDDAKRLLPAQRGRQVFGAMGCATCHAKKDDVAFEDWKYLAVGPDLTERTFPNEWLAAKIRNPAQFAPTTPSNDRMPQLNLAEAHITALVSYINGHSGVTTTDGAS